MKGVQILIEIKNKADCCGCTACAGICPKNCIDMTEDCEGFRYPNINIENCVNCGACENVCPILNVRKQIPFVQEGYIVQNNNFNVLRESTAGGAFTAISKYVLQNNGVVFGVELSEDLVVRHIYVESEEELYRFRNSKYVQSEFSSEGYTHKQVKTFLEQGRYVCFSGTPCQIEGLKNYLRKDYPNLLTVDVVCRAVPSPLVFRKYVDYQEHRLADKIKAVRFRDKYYGYKYSTMNVITTRNHGNYHKGVESDPWLRVFFSNICDRPSCHNCRFRNRYRVSDFTIWDCFHVGRFSKELDNDQGATRMLVHTSQGKEVFRSICSDFKYVQVEPDKIIEGANEMQESIAPNEKRDAFFKDAQQMSGTELFETYFPENIRVKAERMVRILCYRLGIYAVAKKVFVRLIHKY